MQERRQRERDLDPLGGQERLVPRVKTSDGEIVDHELAGQESYRQPANRHVAAQVVAAGLGGAGPQRGAEID